MAGDKKLFSKCLLIRFRLELFVLDNKALVVAANNIEMMAVEGSDTVIPSGVGASCVTFKSVPTVPQPSSS